MGSLYGSTPEKRLGIEKQDEIAEDIRKLMKSWGHNVEIKRSSLNEDMKKKFDYIITFPRSKPYEDREGCKYWAFNIDVKYGATFTLYDNNGQNTLNTSESNFIVYKHKDKPNKLVWIVTERFKSCLQMHSPFLYNSKESGNKSKYFMVESYLEKNKDFMNGFVFRYAI